jgi:hypothetical protein
MAYFLVDNFANGLDLRRSMEVAPPGTLRVLRNAFVNEGGEIEKRKAFVRNDTLTEYGQNTNWKGKVSGPYEVPGDADSVFFMHRYDGLPGGDFTAGGGGIAEYITVGDGFNEKTFWVAKSTLSLTNFGGLFCSLSYSQHGAYGYAVEQYVNNSDEQYTREHTYVTFTGTEPTNIAAVAANAGRGAQMTLLDKGYVVSGDVMYASAVGDPSTMSGTGSGSLNITTQGRPIGTAIGLGDYFGQLAIFGKRGVQFYSVDPDFAQNQYQRSIPASLMAPASITGYGDGDVFFLGKDGVRSLQARDSSNLARVSDVGSPVDKLLARELTYDPDEEEYIFSTSGSLRALADFYDLAKGIVHGETGQFWLCLKDKVHVLSRHPAAKVLAWSTFDLERNTLANVSEASGTLKSRWVADICQVGQSIVFRNFADEVFLYGGENGDTYDTTEVEVITPFMDMGRPGDHKTFTGVDLVCFGDWRVEFTTEPAVDGRAIKWELLGEIEHSTRYNYREALDVSGMQIALRLTTTSPFAARLSQIGVFYDMGAQK